MSSALLETPQTQEAPETPETITEMPETEIAFQPVVVKAKKAKKAKKTPDRISFDQAASLSLSQGSAVDLESIFVIAIKDLPGSKNPRNEPEHLYDLGYVLFGDPLVEMPDPAKDQYVSLVHLALSDNMQKVEYFVNLVKEHESVDREANPNAPQSIVELAEEIRWLGQLQPVSLDKNDHVIEGNRRICARLFLHSESRVLKFKKDQDAPAKILPAVVTATRMTYKNEDELFKKSVKINLSRKSFSELQEGRIYHDYLKKINPDTGKRFTMKEAAADLRVPYGTFRNREALWHKYNPKTKRGLTDDDRRAVANGTMTVTAATRKSLGERHYSSTGNRQPHRAKPIPLKEMQRLFDETPISNKERRQAIAECMGLSLKRATDLSEERLDSGVTRQDRAIRRNNKNRRNRRGRAA